MRFFPVLLLAACSKDPTDPVADPPAAAEVQPESGDWTYVETSVLEDSCGIGEYLDLGGNFAIVSTGPATFRVDDGRWQFDCDIEGSDFSCPERFGSDENMTTMGVALTLSGEAHGTFSSDRAAEGSQSGEADCADAGCDSMASMMGWNPPCQIAVSFTIGL